MDKIWYLYINETEEGPYSFYELKLDPRLSPDTYAWREGMKEWKKISDIPELKILFPSKEEEKRYDYPEKALPPQDELVLDLRRGPPFFLLWLLIALLLIFYSIYELSR